MDGVGRTYERLRNRPFEKLARRLAAVRAAAPFGINYLVNEDTVSELDTAVAFAEEAGASEFLLLPEHPQTDRAVSQPPPPARCTRG
jgi:hypothetical protein